MGSEQPLAAILRLFKREHTNNTKPMKTVAPALPTHPVVTRTLLLVVLALAALMLSAAAHAQAKTTSKEDERKIAQAYVGHTYLLHTDHLYATADNEQGYDLVPVWEVAEVRVTRVSFIESKQLLRFEVTGEHGLQGYFEVHTVAEAAAILEALPATVSAL